MPLASWFSLHFYGPAAAAMVTGGVGTADALDVKGTARAGLEVQGAGAPLVLDATRLVSSPLIVQGAGAVVLAAPKGTARAGLIVAINELSQDDVTGAVLQAPVEDGLTVVEVLRVLLAVAAGKSDIVGAAPTVVTFRDRADTKDRVRAEMTDSIRDAVTVDGA